MTPVAAPTTSRSRVLTPAARCDCSVCPFYIHNRDAAEPVCSGCNSDCEYCGCTRPESGDPNACDLCPVRCGSRLDIADWMASVGGTLRFDDLTFGEWQLPTRLPRFLPVVDTADVSDLDRELGWGAYAVRLRTVVSAATHRIRPAFRDRHAREAMGLRPGQLAVLCGFDQDPLVEMFWSWRRFLIPELAAGQWDLVLAPDMPMYGSSPRSEQLINMRRALLLAQDLNAEGVPTAPHLGWYRLEDLQRIEELLARTRPGAVVVNTQMHRHDRAWETGALPGLAYLASGLPAATTVIVSGTSRPRRIADLRHLFARVVIVSSNATIYARKRAVMTSAGRQERPGRPVAECFAESVRCYETMLTS